MVHVPEFTESWRTHLNDRRCGAQLFQFLVEHHLPARQAFRLEPADDVGQGDMKLISAVIRMSVAEEIGECIPPESHDPIVLYGCTLHDQSHRAQTRNLHVERRQGRKGGKTLAIIFRHHVDRRIERHVLRPVGQSAPKFDNALKHRHVQAGNRREGKLRRLRRIQKTLAGCNDGFFGLRPFDKMAHNRIARLWQELTISIVAATQMARRLIVISGRNILKIFRDERGVHGKLLVRISP
ncbi:conserved hypothetical protein [Agrobacterium tumefaciens str. CFBP 5621]|nr:conserved hypothetical protein [Agrobacterium tumefaciens str. CFBP 5621]